MSTTSETVYRRDERGNWWRDGKRVNTVPERVLDLAKRMSIVCEIRVPKNPRRKKQRTAKLLAAVQRVVEREPRYRRVLEREIAASRARRAALPTDLVEGQARDLLEEALPYETQGVHFDRSVRDAADDLRRGLELGLSAPALGVMIRDLRRALERAVSFEGRTASTKSLRLWKWHPITGRWDYQRSIVNEGDADEWLAIYQKSEPDEMFVVSRNKPRALTEQKMRELDRNRRERGMDRRADLRLGKRDKNVIDAFIGRRSLSGTHLTTDGKRLDIMGGASGVARWEYGKIEFADVATRNAQTVERAVRKAAPKNWLKTAVVRHPFDPQKPQS